MIKVKEALKIIMRDIKILPSETVRLTSALGRVLAEDIYARIDIPSFDNSAMDGYALRRQDIVGASKNAPRVLTVIEDLKAGYVSRFKVKPGQATRIMTGAPLPRGADSVIMVEDTKKIKGKKGEGVKIFKEVTRGENVRRAGEDIKRGERIIPKGTLLNPAHLGILASLGVSRLKVIKKPTIAILATGDELIEVEEKLKPGKLRNSNTYTLHGQILNNGGIPNNLGIARDNPRQLEGKIRSGLEADMLITSGGVSVGDYDLVKDILAKMGTEIRFWRVAMRPGKPLVFGRITARGKAIPVFGLPGNPVSGMISFEVFVRPVVSKMLGRIDTRKNVEAVVGEDIKKKKGLRYFVRAETKWLDGAYATRTTGPQGSGILKSMAVANSLIILPEEAGDIKRGASVTVEFLN